MDSSYPMSTDYHHRHQHQHQHHHTWQPSSFSNPVSPSDNYNSPFPYPHIDDPIALRTSLSLNLSSLSVASPTNLSPINPPQQSTALSPISPSSNHIPYSPHHNFPFDSPHHHHQHHQHPQHHHPQQQQPPPQPSHFDDAHLSHLRRLATPTSSHASSSPSTNAVSASVTSSLSLPRKRSLSSTPSALVDDSPLYDDAPMDLAYDDIPPPFASTPNGTSTAAGAVPAGTPTASSGGASTGGGGGSPVEGSVSSGEDGMLIASALGVPVGGSINILGKPMATNNFVTKLYQMISDPKSAHYIAWTELGTSFVVSNVGEFSRSILGSHFKHNNFSSFVRQLNMYGFHKINRTPRAQRTSTDAQTWEFSHHKFLRGRPDLLDEIKRKALEPDPGVKHRVELPGEVAAQLGAMREENRRLWDHLTAERRRLDKLGAIIEHLCDVVGKTNPGMIPPFPSDILDSGTSESPNIYIISPPTGIMSGTPASAVGARPGTGGSVPGGSSTVSTPGSTSASASTASSPLLTHTQRFPPPPQPPQLSMRIPSMHGHHHAHGMSPGSSPTSADPGADFTLTMAAHGLGHGHHSHGGHVGHHPHGHGAHVHHGNHGHGHGHHSRPSLSRQPSFQHIPYTRPDDGGDSGLDVFDAGENDGMGLGLSGRKRQRTSNDGEEMNVVGDDVGGGDGEGLSTPPGAGGGGVGSGVVVAGNGCGGVGKKMSRARSDSAPLGYAMGGLTPPSWSGTRPRSGSGIAGTRHGGGVGVGGGMGATGMAVGMVMSMGGGGMFGLPGRGVNGSGGPGTGSLGLSVSSMNAASGDVGGSCGNRGSPAR